MELTGKQGNNHQELSTPQLRASYGIYPAVSSAFID